MELWDEIVNYIAIIAPLLVGLLFLIFSGNTPQRRLLSVVIPALSGILAVGFGLQGLTRTCFPNEISCPSTTRKVAFIGNSFGNQKDCSYCAPLDPAPIQVFLNEYRPIVVVVAAVVCCQISLLSIVLFVRWMRKMETTPQR